MNRHEDNAIATEAGSRGAHNPIASDRDSKGSNYFPLIVCAVCALTIAIFFREFFSSRFDLIAGNIGDNRFVIAILEHWRAVFHGQAFFTSPNFFWPQHGVLGYSESFFLFVLPYLAGRAAGLGPYLAFELTLILLKAIGFISMFWLLRSFVNVSRTVALVGSILFTVSNLYFLSIGHGHLVTVVFIPLLAGLACAAWSAHDQERQLLKYLYAGSFGGLLALVFFTSFYVGWFSVLAGTIVLAVILLGRTLQYGGLCFVRNSIYITAARWPILAVAAATFAVGIIPFLITYLPVLHQTGGRVFQEVLTNTAQPIDVINIGRGNWMWGHIVDALRIQWGNQPMVPDETQRGWPLITLVLVVIPALFSLRRRSPIRTDKFFLMVVLSASFLIGWLLSVKLGNHSLWWLVFQFVPGGSAIRVPARFNLVLNIVAIITVSLLLDEVRKRGNRRWHTAFWILSFLLLAEQWNIAPSHSIDRHFENRLLGRVPHAPSNCKVFFLSRPARIGHPLALSANQIDAIWIARRDNVPTLNGYSGWLPPGWQFLGFDRYYRQNVARWVRRNNIEETICGLNLPEASWSVVDFKNASYVFGSVIDFRLGGDAYQYEVEGWGEPEETGSWTLGRRSRLALPLRAMPTDGFWLNFSAQAFAPSQRPKFTETVRVNDVQVATIAVDGQQGPIQKAIFVPRNIAVSRNLRIEFLDSDPRSPAELGISSDTRKLGLAIQTMELRPTK